MASPRGVAGVAEPRRRGGREPGVLFTSISLLLLLLLLLLFLFEWWLHFSTFQAGGEEEEEEEERGMNHSDRFIFQVNCQSADWIHLK